MSKITWSPQQLNFFSFIQNETGSCILEAVAGAGKTTSVLRAAELIGGASIILAYNKKIADEIKQKLTKAGVSYQKTEAATVHAIGYRACRKALPKLRDPNGHKVSDLLDQLLASNGTDDLVKERLQMRRVTLIQLVSLAKQRAMGVLCSMSDRREWYDIIEHFDLLDEDDASEGAMDFLIRWGMRLLTESNRTTDIVDYDDMVYFPLIHKLRCWRYDNVFVDEAQDTNPARRALVRAILKPGGRVIAVGDPHQAIYGFTGADADSLDLIARDFNAKRLPLSITYRCPKEVVNYAHKWVSHIQAADSAPEGKVSTMDFDELVKRNDLDGQSAILCRNVKPLVGAAFALIRRKIACKIEGKEIGASLERLATRWRAIKTLTALETRLGDYRERMITKHLAKKNETLAQQVEDQVDTLMVIIERVREDGHDSVAELARTIRDLFADKADGIITLSTIHKSKGREWQRVYWLDRVATCPSKYARQDWQLQQEDNLCYVAATRAQEELIELTPPPKKVVAERKDEVHA